MSLSPRKPPTTSGHRRQKDGERSASLVSTPLIPEQFKESFALLDKDNDGIISRADLEAMTTSLGLRKSRAEMDEMLNSLPTPLNFAAYFTAMSSLLVDMSSREDLLGALMTFDEGDTGKIDIKEFKDSLTSGRNGLSEAEVDNVIQSFSRNGNFNYHLFVESLAGAA